MTTPQDLVAGFRRFREGQFTDARFRQLVTQGQAPNVLVVACCDSRVDPAIVLDCAPGDLFVIRNVANLVPLAENHGGHHGTSAALEFGVRNLEVEHIIVLGHAHCGGIRTLLESGGKHNPDSFIDVWMQMADEVRVAVEESLPGAPLAERMQACEQQAILTSLHNLMTFPWVRERVENNRLKLHGWYFDIEHGRLLHYNPATAMFEPL